MMIDRSVDDEVRVGFLTAQLSGTLGVGSFDAGLEDHRFDRMLRSGCSLAGALTACWRNMVASVTAARGGAPPTDGALAVPISSAGAEEGKALRKP